jgi:signal transduction histidine kinase
MEHISLDERATAALAIATGEIQVVEDVSSLPPGHALAEALHRLGGSWSKLAVPLLAHGQAIGVLDCLSHRQRTYIAEELEAVTLIAELLASGLQNAFLYENAQEERRCLRAVIDNSPEGIVLFDAPSGAVVLANAAAEQMLGRSMEHDLPIEELPRFYGLLRPNGTPCPVDELPLTRAMRGELVVNQELLIRQPGGQEVATMQNAAPIRENGGPIKGVVLLFQDISRLKQLERQREEFISIVTHDLRAPIAMIIGHVGALRRLIAGTVRELPAKGDPFAQLEPPSRSTPIMQSEPTLEEEIGESVDAIWVSAKRLDTMINDLLVMSRIDARRLPLNKETFSLLDLVQELLRRMHDMLKEHPIRLESGEDTPDIYADPVRVEQVLTNLLLNAAKFAPRGTEIVVRVSRRGDEAVVEVTDQGPGIPSEQLPRLFQRFYRSSGGGQGEGLGLGLYIAKGLVEAHGGRIWAESPAKAPNGLPGRGSTFGFALPEGEPPRRRLTLSKETRKGS